MTDNNKLILLLLITGIAYYIMNENNKIAMTKEQNKTEEDIDCEWSGYGEWSNCKDGKRSRSRTIKTPKSGTGKDCSGETTETENCDNSLWSSLKTRIIGKSNEEWASWIYNSIIGSPTYDDRQTGVVNFAGEISNTNTLNKQQADSVCANVCWWHYNVGGIPQEKINSINNAKLCDCSGGGSGKGAINF